MTRQFPLTQGKVALIDDADFELVGGLTWQARRAKNGKWYAVRGVKADGKVKTFYMHRVLMEPPAGFYVDHANNDGLDNRRQNLRVCTSTQNNINRETRSATGYRGVFKIRTGWRAIIRTGDGFQITTNAMPSPELAAKAYDGLAIAFHGEFAVLNFPEAYGTGGSEQRSALPNPPTEAK